LSSLLKHSELSLTTFDGDLLLPQVASALAHIRAQLRGAHASIPPIVYLGYAPQHSADSAIAIGTTLRFFVVLERLNLLGRPILDLKVDCHFFHDFFIFFSVGLQIYDHMLLFRPETEGRGWPVSLSRDARTVPFTEAPHKDS
jgi:hypothetical protein